MRGTISSRTRALAIRTSPRSGESTEISYDFVLEGVVEYALLPADWQSDAQFNRLPRKQANFVIDQTRSKPEQSATNLITQIVSPDAPIFRPRAAEPTFSAPSPTVKSWQDIWQHQGVMPTNLSIARASDFSMPSGLYTTILPTPIVSTRPRRASKAIPIRSSPLSSLEIDPSTAPKLPSQSTGLYSCKKNEPTCASQTTPDESGDSDSEPESLVGQSDGRRAGVTLLQEQYDAQRRSTPQGAGPKGSTSAQFAPTDTERQIVTGHSQDGRESDSAEPSDLTEPWEQPGSMLPLQKTTSSVPQEVVEDAHRPSEGNNSDPESRPAHTMTLDTSLLGMTRLSTAPHTIEEPSCQRPPLSVGAAAWHDQSQALGDDTSKHCTKSGEKYDSGKIAALADAGTADLSAHTSHRSKVAETTIPLGRKLFTAQFAGIQFPIYEHDDIDLRIREIRVKCKAETITCSDGWEDKICEIYEKKLKAREQKRRTRTT